MALPPARAFRYKSSPFLPRNPYTRCGLYTAIPNAPHTQHPPIQYLLPIKINYIYILYLHKGVTRSAKA
jgi:hypothetical protein